MPNPLKEKYIKVCMTEPKGTIYDVDGKRYRVGERVTSKKMENKKEKQEKETQEKEKQEKEKQEKEKQEK